MKRLPPLRSLRNKLALLFFAITAAAFGVIYFIVVPQLESNLEERKLEDLRQSAAAAESRFSTLIGKSVPASIIDRRVRAAADATGARVTLISFQESLGGGSAELRFFYVLSDSREQREVPVNVGLARRAARGNRPTTGFVTLDGDRYAQLAQPIEFEGGPGWVALYWESLDEVTETVSFVRRRVLAATGAALLVALIGGYLIAQALARRVRRLEQGAEQVAQGRFAGPLPVDSEDELGQLTRTFNDMQEQLRQLDVARKEFVATASHELRTPIFSLAGCASCQ
jgi:signal transduction histidine kinase